MKKSLLTKLLLFSTLLFANPTFAFEPDNHFFDSNGVKIRYFEVGSGEPIIAIHGFLANSELWFPYVSFLAKDYRLILLDQRAHGLSGKPHTVEGYGKEMSRDIVGLMDHLELPKAHLLGYSLGVVALSMTATENESRVLSLTYGGGPPRWEWSPELDAHYQEKHDRWMNTTPEEAKELGIEGHDFVALAKLRLAQKELLVTKESLENLKVPIMAVVGSEDPVIEEVLKFQEAFPSAEIAIIEGGNHGDAPAKEEFRTKVKAFIDKHSEK